jgi:hypothetical protein
MNRSWRRCLATALFIAVAASHATSANAARVGVLSNRYAIETATAFNANIPGHAFTGVDVAASAPSLASLQANYDVVLLFEDGLFANATAVGNVVAQFANSGRAVVLGTFYEQDRSDASNPALAKSHGWGALEAIDPNTTDGVGTPTDMLGVPNSMRSLNASSVATHVLTAGVKSLSSNQFAGGNRAKPGTLVLAVWSQPNALGQPDPAIAVRVTGAACVMHVAIAPQYPVVDAAGFRGDFYRVWKNAFDFGASDCLIAAGSAPEPIPALSDAALALTSLLLAALAIAARRRSTRPR